MKPHIERMLRSMSWADRQTLEAIRSCPAAQAEALPLLAHMLAAEEVWLARLRKQQPTHTVWPQLGLADCEGLVGANAAQFAAFVAGLSENDLASMITYRNMKGEEFTNSVIDILTHVVIHGAYHRGQIAKVLGRSGTQAVSTDYIVFARTAGAASA
jgi:uncharacterized damage-inducible protein DinB